MVFYISFGNYNKKYKYILLGAFCAFLTNCIFGYIYNDNMDLFIVFPTEVGKKLSNHIIYHYIFRFLGISLIAFLKFKWDRKSSKQKIEEKANDINSKETSSSIDLIYKDRKKDIIKNITIPVFFIFSIIAILVIETILDDIYYKSHLKSLDFWMFELPIVTYINCTLFKMKVYRHHYLAIFINLIFSFIYDIASFFIGINFQENEKNVYYMYGKYKYFIPIGIIFYLFIMIPRAYSLCQIKNFMDIKYISPYKILFIYGIVGTIISTLIGIISTFINCNKSSEEMNICKISKIVNNENQTYFENIDLYYKTQENIKDIILEIVTFIVGIITNFFYIFYYILVIKYFTPMHIIFFNLISRFGFYIVDLISNIIFENNKNNNKDKIVTIMNGLGYVNIFLVTFGLLVYLEMIVLNFCGFNYNLKKSITERSIEEYELDKNMEIYDSIEDNDEEEEEEEKEKEAERNDSITNPNKNDSNINTSIN